MCKVQVHESNLSYLLTSSGHGMCAQPGGPSSLSSPVQMLSLGAGPHPQHPQPGPSPQLRWASERHPVFRSLTGKLSLRERGGHSPTATQPRAGAGEHEQALLLGGLVSQESLVLPASTWEGLPWALETETGPATVLRRS